MIGQLAAAIIVIIHAGHIVMHKRGSMNTFHRAGKRHSRRIHTAEKTAKLHDKKGTYAFSSAESAVAHGRKERFQRRIRGFQIFFKLGFNSRGIIGKHPFYINFHAFFFHIYFLR